MRVPILRTSRLIIRPFMTDDVERVHRILYIELSEAEFGNPPWFQVVGVLENGTAA